MTLAERSAAHERPDGAGAAGERPGADDDLAAGGAGGGTGGTARSQVPQTARHCWAVGLPDRPDRLPALLARWARRGDRWYGRVVYAAVDDDGQVVLVPAWLPAEQLESLECP